MNRRDFNLAAKIFLAISMLYTLTGIITSCMKLALPHYGGSAMMIGIIFNIGILSASIFTFLKKRWALISLIILHIARPFATISYDSNIDIAYQLGGTFVYLVRDFFPFAIAMCFKKNGISGWKSMLSNNIDTHSADQENPNTEIINGPIKKQMPLISKLENNPQTKAEISKTEETTSVNTPNTQNDKNNGKTGEFNMKNTIIIIIVIIGSILFLGMAWFTYDSYQKLHKVESAEPNITGTKADQNTNSYDEYLVIFKHTFSFWEKELYNNNSETILLSDTPIYGIVKHSKNQNIDVMSYYYVQIYDKFEIWPGDRLLRNVSKLYEKHPTVLVKKLVHISGDYDIEKHIRLQKVYDEISEKYDLGDFDEFWEKIHIQEKRRIVYNAVKKDYDYGTFDEFENKLGF